MDQTDISLSLPLAQVNIILEALGEQPYRVVSPVIAAVHQQAQPQLAPRQTPQQTAADRVLDAAAPQPAADPGPSPEVQEFLQKDDGSNAP